MDVGRVISVRSASKLLANILFNRRYSPLFTQTIVGGLDDEGASLYVLDVLGSLFLTSMRLWVQEQKLPWEFSKKATKKR